jgi:hypothetical protein
MHHTSNGNKRFSGLLKRINKKFYPHYKYENAIYQTSNQQTRRHQHAISSSTRTSIATQRGIAFERLLHTSIQYSITNQIHSIDMCQLYPPTSKLRSFWYKMNTLKLNPISYQVAVGDVHTRIATAVDILCQHEITYKYCIVEIKYGFQNYYHRHTNKPMSYPFTHLTDCVYHQHMLQLNFTHWLYTCTYIEHQNKMLSPILLRFHSNGCQLYHCPLTIINFMNVAIQQLLLSN